MTMSIRTITPRLLAAASVVCAPVQACHASALTVAPISLAITTPAQSAVLSLRNRDARPLDVQVRVFRWTQVDGQDRLEPSDEVVASPPIVEVGAGGASAVRLQRMADVPPQGEEAYRIVVDEIPDLNRQRNGAVNVLLRYSIPLFVGSPDTGDAHLTWSAVRQGSRAMLVAENDGDRHLQLSDLALRGGARSWPVAPGLSGYVLGHAGRSWALKGSLPTVRPLRVTAGSDRIAVDAPVLR